MYKRCTFYTFVWVTPLYKTLTRQGCIKSCINQKQGLIENPTPIRVLFFVCSGKSDYVNYDCIAYTMYFTLCLNE